MKAEAFEPGLGSYMKVHFLGSYMKVHFLLGFDEAEGWAEEWADWLDSRREGDHGCPFPD